MSGTRPGTNELWKHNKTWTAIKALVEKSRVHSSQICGLSHHSSQGCKSEKPLYRAFDPEKEGGTHTLTDYQTVQIYFG